MKPHPKNRKIISQKDIFWKVISVGILYKENQFLIGLRYPKKKKSPSVWEFPGGSVESGEQPQDTMIRELKEEIGIDVKKWELAACLCDYKKDAAYLIVFHHVLKWSGAIQKNCHQELRWISLAESQKEKWPNVNPALFDKIHQTLNQKLT